MFVVLSYVLVYGGKIGDGHLYGCLLFQYIIQFRHKSMILTWCKKKREPKKGTKEKINWCKWEGTENIRDKITNTSKAIQKEERNDRRTIQRKTMETEGRKRGEDATHGLGANGEVTVPGNSPEPEPAARTDGQTDRRRSRCMREASASPSLPPLRHSSSVAWFGCFGGNIDGGRMMALTADDILHALLRICFEALQFVAQAFFRFRRRKPGKSMPPIDDALLLDSATTLARKIRTKQVTSVRVVETFIRRIKQVNPTFNCIVDLRFDAALRDARMVDRQIAAGAKTEAEMEKETPFLGVPFTVKTCISCRGMRSTAGLVSRRKCVAPEDARVVALMKQAGAIPLASTNISEMCLWWESYNPVHGWTSNPYDSDRTAGGSSGGEGCVQAFAGSPMGLGSDTGGSVRIPAHCNGVFGHKPTNGCTPMEGHFPIPRYPSLRPFLVIGPMSRFAGDLLPMMKVISGDFSDRLKLDEKPDLKRLRYFYMDDDGGSAIMSRVDPEVKAVIRKVVQHLKEAQGVSVQRVDLKRMKHAMMFWFAKMKSKEGPIVAKELANCRGSKNLLWELLLFFLGWNNHTLPILVTGVLERVGMAFGDSQHSFYVKECEALKKDFEELLGTDGVFICPTLPTAAPYHYEAATRPFDISLTAAFNCLGFPATHCPLGLNSKGLPIGVQVVAPEHRDRYCLAVAEELERGFGGWIPPPVRVPDPPQQEL